MEVHVHVHVHVHVLMRDEKDMYMYIVNVFPLYQYSSNGVIHWDNTKADFHAEKN